MTRDESRLIASTFATITIALAVPIAAQTTTRQSVDSGGGQGNSTNFNASISADGDHVVFASGATNLVPGDVNGAVDVFLRDIALQQTELQTLASSSATQADGPSDLPVVASGGRFVAFTSEATNLVAGDTNGVRDIFVRDRMLSTNKRISTSTSGTQADARCDWPVMSPDGRYVVFHSKATSLVSGDTNAADDAFLHDALLATTERVSVGTGGAEGDASSNFPVVTPDGRFVAFTSLATNLVAGDTNGWTDVFVRDRQLATTERVSVGTGGIESDGYSGPIAISADGRFVAFMSVATNLVAGDTNGDYDIFVRDRGLGTTERVSVSSTGAQGDGTCFAPPCTISADGRFVAFSSRSTNLVPGDTNAKQDVFVRDRALFRTERISVSTSGTEGDQDSFHGVISADGRYVLFESDAGNLVAGDTNGATDVFLRDRGASPVVAYCFGDGTGGACPCGNFGIAGHGCGNSVDPLGGVLAATGTPSVAADTFALTGTGMPSSSALYFQGTAVVNGGNGSPFGDGLRCAGGTVIRLGTQTNAGGTSSHPSGPAPLVSVGGMVSAGSGRAYQVWYRNAASFCTPSTYNLTNGLYVHWMP